MRLPLLHTSDALVIATSGASRSESPMLRLRRFGFLILLAACGTEDAPRTADLAAARAAQAGPPANQAGSSHGTVLNQPPAAPEPDARYVFYVHGRFVEEHGSQATDPRWGPYEYQAILDSLAAPGFVVISEARPAGTDMRAYAQKLADQVRTLLRAGVPPQHVTVVGFSKGGGISMIASSMLQNPRINFVFIAACGRTMFEWPGLRPSGRVLSIYDASDDVRSCEPLWDASNLPAEYRELELHTGRGHGAFYQPRPEWLDPIEAWISGAPRV